MLYKHIEKEFADYRKNVIPEQAGPFQVEECKKAFYAGSASVIIKMVEHSNDAMNLYKECEQFFEELKKKQFPRHEFSEKKPH